ncbi:MAG: DUF1800 family protein [Pseudomonadota bacterium]
MDTEEPNYLRDKSEPNAGALSTMAIASFGLAGCGGEESSAPGVATTETPSPTTAASLDVQNKAAARAALHSTLSVSDDDIATIVAEGFEKWLDRELVRPNDGSAEQFFKAHGFDEIDTNAFWGRDYPLDHMIWSQLLHRGSGLRMRMALALSEIFVVSINELDIPWRSQAVGQYWDLLNKHAFGSFRELLEDVTLNPAVGVFLDHAGNTRADPSSGRVPDENYAREILQLFTIGLLELNLDGSIKTNANGPIETYTNADVEGLAKVFTGFDLDYSGVEFFPDPRGRPSPIPDVKVIRQPMTADPRKWLVPQSTSTHSSDEKRFLGTFIPPGTGPEQSLKRALDHIFNHPNVAPFFSLQLIQRLVTSNPSPGYIERVARVFENNGFGTRGDLRATFKAVVTDPEATGEQGLSDPRFGKLREPMIRFAQWGRTFGARSPSQTWQIRNLGDPGLLSQAPFRAASVFNFFRPNYIPPRSQAAANNLLAPEFQIVDESSVPGYVNFMRRTIEGTGFWTDDIAADYKYEVSIAHDANGLVNHLDLVLSGGQLRASSRELIKSAIEDVSINAGSEDDDRLRRAHIGVMLVMCSNDYLVQK